MFHTFPMFLCCKTFSWFTEEWDIALTQSQVSQLFFWLLARVALPICSRGVLSLLSGWNNSYFLLFHSKDKGLDPRESTKPEIPVPGLNTLSRVNV